MNADSPLKATILRTNCNWLLGLTRHLVQTVHRQVRAPHHLRRLPLRVEDHQVLVLRRRQVVLRLDRRRQTGLPVVIDHLDRQPRAHRRVFAQQVGHRAVEDVVLAEIDHHPDIVGEGPEDADGAGRKVDAGDGAEMEPARVAAAEVIDHHQHRQDQAMAARR